MNSSPTIQKKKYGIAMSYIIINISVYLISSYIYTGISFYIFKYVYICFHMFLYIYIIYVLFLCLYLFIYVLSFFFLSERFIVLFCFVLVGWCRGRVHFLFFPHSTRQLDFRWNAPIPPIPGCCCCR